MTAEDWQQAWLTDPILDQVIANMQDGNLGQCPYKQTDSPEFWQHLQECKDLKLRQSILYRKVLPRGSWEALFQLVLPTAHRETTLEGCHDEIGHLGLERMLDLMHNLSSGPKWLCRQRSMSRNVASMSPSRQNSRRPPWKAL